MASFGGPHSAITSHSIPGPDSGRSAPHPTQSSRSRDLSRNESDRSIVHKNPQTGPVQSVGALHGPSRACMYPAGAAMAIAMAMTMLSLTG